MGNTYRALSPQAEAVFASGVFEAEFTPMEEKDHLDGGLIELVPRRYKVLSNNFSAGPQGSEISAVFRVENEAALIQGGHIERLDDGSPGEPSTVKELSAEGGQGGKAASKQKKED